MLAILQRTVLLAALAQIGGAASAQRISVALNGNPVRFAGTEPQEVNGRVMVPMRGIFEQLGAKVKWDGLARMVTATRAETVVKIAINQNSAEINGKWIPIGVPAMILVGRTMVPLRFVAESFGAAVTWDDSARIVRIAMVEPDDPAVVASNPQQTETAQTDPRPYIRPKTPAPLPPMPPKVTGEEPITTTLAFIRENAVIPVVLDVNVHSRQSAPGDKITATVEFGGYDGRLPKGAKFVGTIRHAIPASAGRPGIVSIEFTELAFPDKTWRAVNGKPYPLNGTKLYVGNAGYLMVHPDAGVGTMMFVGGDNGTRLSRADVLPNGRARTFSNPTAATMGNVPKEMRTGEVVLPAGHRFGVRLTRELTFDPVVRTPKDDG